EAEELFVRARESCVRAGDRSSGAMAAGNLGELLVSRGALDAAEPILVEARRSLRAAGLTPYALFAEIQRARMALAPGRESEAMAALDEILAEAPTTGHSIILLEAVVHYAHAQVARDPAEGLAALDAAEARAGEDVPLLAVALGRARGECLAALGRLDEADTWFDRALAGALQQNLLYEQYLIRSARSGLARTRGVEPNG